MTLGAEPRPVPKGARQHSASPLASQAETASQQPVSAKAKCQHHAGLPQGPRPNRGGITLASMVGETRRQHLGGLQGQPPAQLLSTRTEVLRQQLTMSGFFSALSASPFSIKPGSESVIFPVELTIFFLYQCNLQSST